MVRSEVEKHSICCELNLKEGCMTAIMTKRTLDHFAIMKVRDFITLLAWSVPVAQVWKILQDDMISDLVKIS